MLNKIIQFSLHNRLTVIAMAVLLFAGGCYIAYHMEVDVFPDLNAPTVVVMTEASGMAPEEVERLVTLPVETSVNGATGVRRVRSSSATGFSVVWVEFDWGTDIYRARQIVSEKLDAAAELLPTGVGRPVMGPQSSILGEVMFIGLTSDSVSLLELRTLADWTIRPRLLSVGGVAQVSVLGGEIKEYQILLDAEKMRYYGVSTDDILQATDGMNRNVSGGVLYEHGNEYIIRGLLSTLNPEELGLGVVKKADGVSVQLSDVAEVRIGSKSPKTGVASVSGRPAVLMTVTKQQGVGTIKLTKELDRTVEEMKRSLPPDVEVRTDLYRQQRFIESSVGNIQKSLIEGGIFVVLVLFVFLMNVRTTIISLVTIPLSLLVSIITLRCMGLTVNTMSIGGMAIAIGSLVDDAVVDVENVYKHIQQNRQLPPEKQRPMLQVVFEASKEVRMPILNSTLIIIVSFLPLFFLSGMEGRMLAPLGVAFIVALFASTLVALTLTPVLCSYLPARNGGGKNATEPFVVRRMKRGYRRALQLVLNRKKTVLWFLGGLLAVTATLAVTLGRNFLPPFNEGSFTVNVSTLPGISLEESDKIGGMAEKILLEVPEVQAVARKTGRAELDEHALGINVSEMEAPFVLEKRSKDEVATEIRNKLKTLPGVNIEIGQPISHRINAMLSGTQANIAVKLFGTDLNRMFSLAHQIKEKMEEVPGLTDLNVEQQVERPQLKIKPKREMLAEYGITLPQFARAIQLLLGGETVSSVQEGNCSFDLTVKVNDEGRAAIETIRDLTIDASDGRKIPLENVAHVLSATGPDIIHREDVSRKIVVSANVAGRDLRGAVDDIRERVSRISMPDGYRVEYGGQFESEQAASKKLLITSFFSVLMIFLLLYKQFKSLIQSAVVLLNLPLALIGGVFAVCFTSGEMSIPALIGFISLFGIATRNGMLLIDRYNDLHRQGLSAAECVMQGSLDRLNPIVMTALTSALALIPLAVGGDLPGNEIQSPMAQVMLGGLLSSTLLNAFVIPVMYMLMNRQPKKVVECKECVNHEE